MKKLMIFAVLFASVALMGCNGLGVRGSGIVKDENREVEAFSSIEIGGAYQITIECGKEPNVKIIADDNIIPFIETEVRGDKLHVWNRTNISPRKKIKIHITTNDLNNLEAYGASTIAVRDINNESFSVEASGAGELRLIGRTEQLKLVLSGAVNVKAATLEADNVFVEISGASNADVFANEELRAEISGVGNIDYSGNPKNVKKRISGLGSITQR